MTAPPPLAPGRYRLERQLGAGGMGVVYEAQDLEQDRQVALKVLRDVDPRMISRFKHEFRSLADVSHPNLVALHELVAAEGHWFFTMELVRGVDFMTFVRGSTGDARSLPSTALSRIPSATALEEINASRPTIEGRLEAASDEGTRAEREWTFQLDLVALRRGLGQLCQGVQALHDAGKLHRDLKPSNVMVTSEGRVVILDFGLVAELEPLQGEAAIAAPVKRPSRTRIAGTPEYMSPEQGSARTLGPASDWYAVGVMLYEALTGRLPFFGGMVEMLVDKQRYEPARPREIIPETPEDLDVLCMDLLRRAPEHRPTGIDVLRRLGVQDQAALVRSGSQGSRATLEERLVGRERELGVLEDALAGVAAGRTVVLFVHGESGMGKSALVRAFVEKVRQERRAVVRQGRCFERESVPYKALDDLVDDLYAHLARLEPAVLEALLSDEVVALARVFPVLLRLEAVVERRGRTQAPPDPQELRRRAFTGLRTLLRRIADGARSGGTPLILAVDDLQWSDADSLALLLEIIRPPRSPPLMLLLSVRTEDLAVVGPLRTALEGQAGGAETPLVVSMLEAAALGPAQAEALALALMTGGQGENATPTQRARASRIARESAGCPLYVEELTRHLEGHAAGRDEAGVAEISLEAVLAARIDRLPPEARALLEATAVAGAPSSPGILTHAAGLGTDAASAMGVLRAAQLVRGRAGARHEQVECFHDRIRETVVRQMSHERPADLAALHRRLALALEAAGGADPELLSVHRAEAGDRAEAALHAMVAGDRAGGVLAFDRAARLYRRALELGITDGDQAHAVRVKLGEALAHAGRGLEAAQVYQAALSTARAADAIELRRRAADQLLRSGHVDRGVGELEPVLGALGLKLAKSPRGALLALVARRARLALRGLGYRERDATQISPTELTGIDLGWSVATAMGVIDHVRAAEFQTFHLMSALAAGEPFRVARALAIEACYRATPGEPARAESEALIARADAIAARLGRPPRLEGLLGMTRTLTAFLVGDWRRAREHGVVAEQLLRDRCTDVQWELSSTEMFLLGTFVYLGEVTELRKRHARLLRQARAHGDLYAETNFRVGHSSLVWLAEDQEAHARAELEDAMSRWSRRSFHMQHYFALRTATQIDLYGRQGARAWARLEETWPALEASMLLRNQLIRIECLWTQGRAAIAAAVDDESRRSSLVRVAERAASSIEREERPWGNPLAALILGAVADLRGQRDEAVEQLQAAARGLSAAAMQLHALCARRRAAQLGAGGAGELATVDAEIRRLGVVQPSRFVNVFAPGRFGV